MGGALNRNEILLGARLGPYEIVRFIGQGATAGVFEGRHTALRKPVAIKVLHEHLTADRSVVARFAREGRTAAQLRHPHSLDVLDVGEERGVAYLVMELLDGTNLDVHLRDRGVLPLEEALKLLFPTAAALLHAHGHGVIHRDVKPGNIFLARDARGTLVPKLVDFGISKLMDAPEGAPLTATNDILGTVRYMAPEQTTGSKYATAKSDQYSLAAVLYECVTGRAPFTADGWRGRSSSATARGAPLQPDHDARDPRGYRRAVLPEGVREGDVVAVRSPNARDEVFLGVIGRPRFTRRSCARIAAHCGAHGPRSGSGRRVRMVSEESRRPPRA